MKNEEKKSGFVTLIGRPNVGKSTLMNQIIGQKIAITSHKPQTTRNKILAVLSQDEGQIVFLDTPGIHKAQNKLGEYMVSIAEQAVRDVDLILWLVEPATFSGAGEQYIIEQLQKTNTPVFLIVNKIDLVKKDQLLEIVDMYSKLYHFAAIIPVSAIKKDNIQHLIQEIYKMLPEGPQFFDEDTVTDQPERQITAELIREKALKLLEQEIPHGIAVSIEQMKTRKNGVLVDIDAVIVCEKDSHKGIIIGKQGQMLKKIGTAARFEIEKLLGTKVNLKLWVKIKKDWRDNDYLIKNYGYHDVEQ